MNILDLQIDRVSQEENEKSKQLVSELEELSKSTAKRGAVKKYTNIVDGTDVEISSWRFNEWDYSSKKVKLPIYARGLFTVGDRIVCRGYDKFFNVDELGSVSKKALQETTTGPYTLTVKANGCIVFISGLENGTLVVCSKNSTGYRDELTHNHALAAQAALKRQLEKKGINPKELATTLHQLGMTAVAEYCDDSFEEHIIEYTQEKAGLYLHGLNYNTCDFKTCSMTVVTSFAQAFGFKTIDYFELPTFKAAMEFLEKASETGLHKGEEIEGFVVRCQKDNSDFFFKYKFEEPYLLYRELREVTKQYLAKGVDKVSFKNHKLICMDYLKFVIPLFDTEPALKEDYLKGKGIVKMRKLYMEHKQQSVSEIIKEEQSVAKLEEELKCAGYGQDTCKYVLVTVATIGCGKTTTSMTLANLFPDLIGVVQSDDIPSPIKNKQVAKCLEVLVEKPIVILDRNNHKFIERQQTFEYFADLNKLIPASKLKFICLNFLGNMSKDDPKLWEITRARVLERGDNHQSIKVERDGSYKAEMIMKGFLGRFQPVEKDKFPDSRFDHIIDLVVEKNSSLENAKLITRTLAEIASDLNVQYPNEEQFLEAYQKALEFKPVVTKNFKTKKQKPQYFGIQVNDIDKLGQIHEIGFFKQLQEANRVKKEFHITLIHVGSTKKNPPMKAIYQKYCELIKDTEHINDQIELPYKADAKLVRICWNSRVMCIEAEVKRIYGKEGERLDSLGIGNRYPHITVGTISEKVQAVESNKLLADLHDFGDENINTQDLNIELNQLPLFVHY
ncbi:hypothetical protein KL911_002742 [Ogataea haglerorum]|uniref:uncharacterized protein n=1 Tax=Ogataea haglerorum TaxID=1937702 RepID=UPI001C8A0CFF|nr:uncharacterized protein KL911_002742 [Ogataea haglerorum]KAG7753349.1 hypothetical protein KL911_002742 [Ogataea haglerorum]